MQYRSIKRLITFLFFIGTSLSFSQRNCAPPHIYFGLTDSTRNEQILPDNIMVFVKGKKQVSVGKESTLLDTISNRYSYSNVYRDTSYWQNIKTCQIGESVLCHPKSKNIMFYFLLKDYVNILDFFFIEIEYKKNKMRIKVDFSGKEGSNPNEHCTDCFIYYEKDYEYIMQPDIDNMNMIVFQPYKEYIYKYLQNQTSNYSKEWERQIRDNK